MLEILGLLVLGQRLPLRTLRQPGADVLLLLKLKVVVVIAARTATILSLHPLQPLLRSFSGLCSTSTRIGRSTSLSSVDTVDMFTKWMSDTTLMAELVRFALSIALVSSTLVTTLTIVVIVVGGGGLDQLETNLRCIPLKRLLLLGEISERDLVLGQLGLTQLVILGELVHHLVVVVPGELLQAALADEPRCGNELVVLIDSLEVLEQEADLLLHPEKLDLVRLGGVNLVLKKLINQLGSNSAGIGVLGIHVLKTLIQGEVMAEIIVFWNTVTDGVEEKWLIKEVADMVLPLTNPLRIISHVTIKDWKLSFNVIVASRSR